MTALDTAKEFIKRYYHEPALYVTEIIGVEKLEPWQSELLRKVSESSRDLSRPRNFAIRSGHGIGKTSLMAWINKWFMATRPNPQILVTANTETQLSTKTWRELAKWNKISKDGDWFEWTATRFSMKSAKDTWFASAIPWTEKNSEAFAGAHEKDVLRLFDEASSIADVIWEVAEGAGSAGNAWWFVFGNPTRNNGRFVECWGKYRHRWDCMEIDAREVSIADQKQIQQWIDDEGEDSDFVRVRVRGIPPRSSMLEFIGVDDWEKCRLYKSQENKSMPRIIGMDCARFGDDYNTIYARQGRKVWLVDKWRGLDTQQGASRLVDAFSRENATIAFVDGGGPGGGIIDRAKVLIGSDKVIEINFGGEARDKARYANKRAEMWGDARDAMRAGLELPDEKELRTDLLGPLYSFTNKQQILLEKKSDMKKRGLSSPDHGDGFVLTFAQNVIAQTESLKGSHSGYASKMGFA